MKLKIAFLVLLCLGLAFAVDKPVRRLRFITILIDGFELNMTPIYDEKSLQLTGHKFEWTELIRDGKSGRDVHATFDTSFYNYFQAKEFMRNKFNEIIQAYEAAPEIQAQQKK